MSEKISLDSSDLKYLIQTFLFKVLIPLCCSL